jgi:hypothetical protein
MENYWYRAQLLILQYFEVQKPGKGKTAAFLHLTKMKTSILLTLFLLVATTFGLDLSDNQARRMIAAMQTKEAAALEAQYHVDHAAGLHDQMVRIGDRYYSSHSKEGTAREQELRKSFHIKGFYHTLYHVAETLNDYALLETEVKQAHEQFALDLSPDSDARRLMRAAPMNAFVETEAKWGSAKRAYKRAKAAAAAAARRVAAAARAAAAAAARAARAVANALSQAASALADLRNDASKGVDEIRERLGKIGDFAGEVVSEIKSTAENIKKKVLTVASSMKRAAGHIKTPFDQVLSHLGNNLPTALQDKSDCHNLKIKPTGVGVQDRNFRKCFNFLPGNPCPSMNIPIPQVTFEEKQICNPSKAVMQVAGDAFNVAAESLQSSAKAAIDEIVNSGDGGTFLEITEGQGNTAQVSIFLFIFSKLFFIYLTHNTK